MRLIEVQHLETVAGRPDGKAYLGALLRRLIYATVALDRPNLHFLAGETNNQAGWDGWLEVTYDDHGRLVTHRSVWELSTEERFEAKFRGDFESAESKLLPNGWSSDEVVYVGLTLRNATQGALRKVKKWASARKKRKWAGLVFLAADDLVQWLEKVPTVSDWFESEFDRKRPFAATRSARFGALKRSF
jgi:hypothetical protein